MRKTAKAGKGVARARAAKAARPAIVIGSDHAGFATKQRIVRALANAGYTIMDVGTFSADEPVDYPGYAKLVAKEVARDPSGTKGILVCGSGTGMVIAANKVRGIRAAFAFDAYGARMARKDNDANVLALRGRRFPQEKAAALALAFLKAPFSGAPRHVRRVREIAALEGG